MATHSTTRSRLTLALLVVAFVLIGVIGWMEFTNKPPDSIDEQAINSITIKRNDHAAIVLSREGSSWNISAPYSIAANAQRVNPLLTLGTARFDGYDASEVDLAATGLQEPEASIRIGEREFMLGNLDAAGERRYALLDNTVSFVPSWVWSLVHGGVSAFADLTVFKDLPEHVFLLSDDQAASIDNTEAWSALQADKIVAWPDSDSATSDEVTARWQLSATNTANNDATIAHIVRFQEHSLINTTPGFAYAISNARLDVLLPP